MRLVEAKMREMRNVKIARFFTFFFVGVSSRRGARKMRNVKELVVLDN